MSRAVLWVGERADAIREVFEGSGYQVEFSPSPNEARRILLRREPQSIVFGGAGADALSLIGRWRAEGRDIPILVGARPDSEEPRKALSAGATDYLLCPITPRAALTRLETHLSRRPAPTRLELSDRRIDLAERRVRGPHEDVELTAIEARLLAFLGAEPDRPMRTETILREVWGYGHALQTRAVANTVMRLRRKIEVDPRKPCHLLTVRGVGYRLAARAATRRAMPRPAGPLIGRRATLEATQAALTTGPVLLHGPPGVGKSRLAHAVAEAWHGPVTHLELDDVATAEQLLQAVALRLATPLPAGSTLRALGAALAARGPLLLWLDGADRVAEVVCQAVSHWTPGRPRVLITSQVEVRLPGVTTVRLGPLSTDEALDLLADRARDAGAPPGLDFDSPAAAALVETLDRLPLALVLAARRLPFIDFDQLRRRTAAITGQESLGRSLSGAWAQLDAASQRLLWTAAQFVGPFGLEALERVADFDGPDDPWLPDVLVALIRRSLVEQDTRAPDVARFSMLACVRHWARRHPPAAEIRAAVEARVVDYVLEACEAAAAGLEGREPARSLRIFDRLLPALRALGTHAEPTVRLRASLAAGAMLHFRGTLVGHVDGLLACVPSGDDHLDDQARIQAARFCLALGRLDDASAHLATVTTPALAAAVDAERAEIAIANGDFDATVAAAQDGAAHAREPFLLGRLLDLEATARHHRGEDVEALQSQALTALRRAGATWYQAIVRHNLAFDALERGELASALRDFERFGQVARACESRLYQATVGVNIGRVLIERGDGRDAEVVLRRSLADLREADFRRGEALAIANLALALIEQRRPVAARHCLQEAIAVATTHGIGRVQGQGRLWLGVLAHLAGDLDTAAAAYADARRIAPSHGRLATVASEAGALLALEAGRIRSELVGYQRDPARLPWMTAFIDAVALGNAAAQSALIADPFVARSFEGRVIVRLAERLR